MPVVKQKGEDPIVTQDELLECTLHKTLDICGKHHEVCSRRRKNGVDYEIRVERQRSEWLTRKCLDNLRQQQALSGRLEVPARQHLSSSSDSAENMDTTNIKQSPERQQASLTPQRDMPEGNNPCPNSDTKAHITQGGHTSNGHQNSSETLPNVVVKTEPTSVENTPTCTKSPPRPSPAVASSRSRNKTPPGSISLPTSNGYTNSSNGIGPPELKKRRISLRSPPKGTSSLRGRSFSSPEDLEDELTLSAEEFITGVSSNPPPIKPLEEGDEPPITPSPPTSTSQAKADPPKTSSSAVSQESSSGVANSPDASMRQDLALRQDLDEFSKIMSKVTHEQNARERHNSYSMLPNHLYTTAQSSDLSASHTYTQAQVQSRTPIISPPPYFVAGTEPVSPAHYFHPSNQLTSLQRHLSVPPSPSYLPSPHLPPHHLHTQVDYPQPPPVNLQPRPPQKPHPRHLPIHSAISQHPPQPPLMSPTIHTPISARPFVDHNLSNITAPPHPPHTPNNLPQTPTTPLEHYSTFSSRPSSQISPTHTHIHTPPNSLPNIFPTTNQNPQQSPTVTIAENSWDRHQHITHMHPQGSLRDALLTQVNTRLEALTGQSHSMGLGFAPRISQSASVRPGIPMPGMQLLSQYPASYTGLSSSLPHTISYPGQHSNSAFHHPM